MHLGLTDLAPLKKRIIFRITGKHGSYLSEFLFGLDCEFPGMIGLSSGVKTSRLDHLLENTNGNCPFILET
jgi:GDP-D-mannose dehydratase